MSATGTIKAWNEQRGFGFITNDADGIDVYFHRVNIANAESAVEGDLVRFDVAFDAKHNKNCAKNVTTSAGSAAIPASKGNHGLSNISAMIAGSNTGIVKAWNEARGFGFIQSDVTGEDLYFHRTSLADGAQAAAVGVPVTFDVEFDERAKKNCAVNVVGAGAGAVAPAKGAGKGKGLGAMYAAPRRTMTAEEYELAAAFGMPPQAYMQFTEAYEALKSGRARRAGPY
mmetsp:Transcript_20883/g.51202  ORF Transcript_20883/g.51202 Transcript_20883/m.51202 type:complete len:228 (+) Transcript_20883:36-719(+)